MASVPSEPSYYQILSLPNTPPDDPKEFSLLLKRAYHRALLRHHPDKAGSGDAAAPQALVTSGSKPQPAPFSVDQITTAFAVLSKPTTRAQYDRALAAAARTSSSPLGPGGRAPGFQTGIETVDLDDLAYDAERGGAWYRGCRCGNEMGFQFGEADLEEAAEVGELVVGCQDCSLWLRVHFSVVEEDGDGGRGGGGDGGGDEDVRLPASQELDGGG